MRRIVVNAIRAIGYGEASEAQDGVRALEQIEAAPPDLVITGWAMPNMNGIELCRAIRKHDRYRMLPVLLITTRGTTDNVLEAEEAGVSDCIWRPFTRPMLRDKIAALLGTPAPSSRTA